MGLVAMPVPGLEGPVAWLGNALTERKVNVHLHFFQLVLGALARAIRHGPGLLGA